MIKVLITGGTGLVGKKLSSILIDKGYRVSVLSRSMSGTHNGIEHYLWDVDKGELDKRSLEADHIIHLAGSPVNKGVWTASRKKELYDSRISSIRLLTQHIEKHQLPVQSFISTSAVGYYGDRPGEKLDETSAMGKGFLAELCGEWEREAIDLGNKTDIPVAIVRTGIALSLEGGALPALMLPVKMGISAYPGNGKQVYPWIHLDDLCNLYIHLLENRLTGIYNGTAPHPVPCRALFKTIAKALGKPFLPVPSPGFFFKAALGEKSSLMLYSQHTVEDKTIDSGFHFSYPDLEGALDDLFSGQR